jgi:hypothetical protein
MPSSASTAERKGIRDVIIRSGDEHYLLATGNGQVWVSLSFLVISMIFKRISGWGVALPKNHI